MKLDSFMCRVPADFIKDQGWVDINVEDIRDDMTEIQYWRKHGKLQNWMHNRYRQLNGNSEDFNRVYLRLFEHDIIQLISDLKTGDGFFFGDEDQIKDSEDLEFFEKFLTTANFKKYGYTYIAWY